MSLSERRRRIIEAVSIAVVVGEYVPLGQSGSSLKAFCPFHDDRSTTLDVEPVGRHFQCRDCGISGYVVDFLCKFESIPISEALDLSRMETMESVLNSRHL